MGIFAYIHTAYLTMWALLFVLISTFVSVSTSVVSDRVMPRCPEYIPARQFITNGDLPNCTGVMCGGVHLRRQILNYVTALSWTMGSLHLCVSVCA